MAGTEPATGAVVWADLTVPDAAGVARFYEAVVGWKAEPVAECGGDFNMTVPGVAGPVAGVCYARGPNATLPPQWLIYVRVKDVEASAAQCAAAGGKVLGRVAGNGYVIQDPAGAVMAILPAG